MKTGETSRPEAVFVLLLFQATFWAAAGLSAFPFALAGEVFMVALGLMTWLLAGLTCALGVALVRRWRRARRLVIALETVSLVGSLLLLVVPIGANHGPIALMVNVALPAAILALLWGKKMKRTFASAG